MKTHLLGYHSYEFNTTMCNQYINNLFNVSDKENEITCKKCKKLAKKKIPLLKLMKKHGYYYCEDKHLFTNEQGSFFTVEVFINTCPLTLSWIIGRYPTKSQIRKYIG